MANSFFDQFNTDQLKIYQDGVGAVVDIVGEFDENIERRPNSAFYELMAKPIGVVNAQILYELETIIDRLTLTNYATLAEADMDRIVANLFLSRRLGARATGSVRIYFSEALDVAVPEQTVFKDDQGLRYLTTISYWFPAEELIVNKEGFYHYVDVRVEAEDEGEDYNIGAHLIVEVEGLQAPWLRVDNLYAFAGGRDRETNTELYARARDALVSRTLTTKRGITTVLKEQFDWLTDMLVIGFGDDEMERDMVRHLTLESRAPLEIADFYAKRAGQDIPVPHYLYKAIVEEGTNPTPAELALPAKEVSQDDYHIVADDNLSYIFHQTNLIFEDDFARDDSTIVGNSWITGENDLPWGKELFNRECRLVNQKLILGIETITAEEELYLNKFSNQES